MSQLMLVLNLHTAEIVFFPNFADHSNLRIRAPPSIALERYFFLSFSLSDYYFLFFHFLNHISFVGDSSTFSHFSFQVAAASLT